MTEIVRFTVYGKPQPGGSKRAFVNKGRAIVTDANKNAKPWQAEIKAAAQTAMLAQAITNNGTLVDAPLAVSFTFFLPRPKGHFGAKGLRPSAPDYPATRPDLLKYARAAEDAMTGIVWRDDAQIVVEHLEKRYGEPIRLEVVVATAAPLDLTA